MMAFEHMHWPVYGVQFHPESILTECGYDLLANFLTIGRRWMFPLIRTHLAEAS